MHKEQTVGLVCMIKHKEIMKILSLKTQFLLLNFKTYTVLNIKQVKTKIAYKLFIQMHMVNVVMVYSDGHFENGVGLRQ